MRFFQRIRPRSSILGVVAPLAVVAAVVGLRGARAQATGDVSRVTSESNIDSLVRDASGLSRAFAEISDSNARVLERVSTKPVAMPTEGWLSSRYANRRLHPITNRSQPHHGIDVAAPKGTAITAPGAGRVLRVVRTAGYGLMLELDHGDGIVTRYGHCSKVLVKPGTQVTRGAVIALVGNTGLSTGPHLHYEIIYHGRAIDPLTFIY